MTLVYDCARGYFRRFPSDPPLAHRTQRTDYTLPDFEGCESIADRCRVFLAHNERTGVYISNMTLEHQLALFGQYLGEGVISIVCRPDGTGMASHEYPTAGRNYAPISQRWNVSHRWSI